MVRAALLLALAAVVAACTSENPSGDDGASGRLAELGKELVQLRADLNEARVRIEELEKATGLAAPPGGDGADEVAAPGPLAGPPEAKLDLAPLPPQEPVVALSNREPVRRRAWKWTRLSRSQVAETVRDHALAIHKCLAPLLGRGAKEGASVDLRFSILRSGQVEDVRLGALPGGRESCLQAVFAGMRFPQYSGKTMLVSRLPLSLAWQPADPESALVLEGEVELSQGR